MTVPGLSSGPVVLATGGTGGHVFPAEALAGELEARGVPFALVTDSRGRQWQGALSRRPIHYIRSASPSGSVASKIKAGLTLALGLFDAWRALGRIGPSAVVGFGGYASVPTMVAARLRRLPSMLHEQNAVLGKANRTVQGGAGLIATSFARTRFLAEGDSRVRLVGNPVREPVRTLRTLGYRPPSDGRIIDVLVFGGSQGAASFSQVVPQALLALPPALRPRLRVVQQCRAEDLDSVRRVYAKHGVVAELAPFFSDLPARIARAHLVVARSGASTVAELCVIGRPSVLVPLPHALDQDQLANASALADAGGALLVPQDRFTPRHFADELARLSSDTDALGAMAFAARSLGRADAAERLADLVLRTAGLS